MLHAAGIERLTLFGAAERPAFAREISLRFPGGVVFDGAAGLLRAARFSPSPVVSLGAGLYRVDAGAAVPLDAQAVLCRAPDSKWPAHAAGTRVSQAPLANDPETCLGAGVGLAPPDALAGTPDGADLRAAWGAFWPHADFRTAILGMEPGLEAAIFEPVDSVDTVGHPPLYAVTGMDGSGKSTHVEHLALAASRGGALRVGVVKLYRQGAFLVLADELGARTRRGAPLSAFRLSRVVKLWDSLRVLAEVLPPAALDHDVLILDRWTETHLAAAESQLGWDLRRHGALARLPPPDGCVWLLLPPDAALGRLVARGTPLTADEHPAGLAGYAQVFDRLAVGERALRLDARDAEAENAARIRAFFSLGALDEGAGSAPTPPPQAPPERPRGTRCQVVVGAVAGLPSLGASLWNATRCAGPVSADFVLEGLAARVLLDVRETRPARACAPIWPAALAAIFPDQTALDELDRLLDREVDVVGWHRPQAADFARLGTPAGVSRLVITYGQALERLAAERGWPLLPDLRSGP